MTINLTDGTFPANKLVRRRRGRQPLNKERTVSDRAEVGHVLAPAVGRDARRRADRRHDPRRGDGARRRALAESDRRQLRRQWPRLVRRRLLTVEFIRRLDSRSADPTTGPPRPTPSMGGRSGRRGRATALAAQRRDVPGRGRPSRCSAAMLIKYAVDQVPHPDHAVRRRHGPFRRPLRPSCRRPIISDLRRGVGWTSRNRK